MPSFSASPNTAVIQAKGFANTQDTSANAQIINGIFVDLIVQLSKYTSGLLDIHGNMSMKIKDGATVLASISDVGSLKPSQQYHNYLLRCKFSSVVSPEIESETHEPGSDFVVLAVPQGTSKVYTLEVEFNGFTASGNSVEVALVPQFNPNQPIRVTMQDKAAGRCAISWDIQLTA
jgi:hypothetical protein